MGIKRKKQGPSPTFEPRKPEWQQLVDRGCYVDARFLLLRGGMTAVEAIRAELAYRNRLR